MSHQIHTSDLYLPVGPFIIGARVQVPDVLEEILTLYRDFPIQLGPLLCDFRILMKPSSWLRSKVRRQLQIRIDNQRLPIDPVPYRLGTPLFESSINYCLSARVTRLLMLHAAVVERNGYAIVMPGPSGAGKSTLSAALLSNGWRLLSDEVALIDLKCGLLTPHPRPVSLKNESIDLVSKRFPNLEIPYRYPGTGKGTIAYALPPRDAVMQSTIAAKPALVVGLSYTSNSQTKLKTLSRIEAFQMLVQQSPNYKVLLERGFLAMCEFVETCEHYALTYSRIDEAVMTIEELSQRFCERELAG
jgi:HprK-related kinase A